MPREQNHPPLIAAGTLLGIGLGGFVDGIVLHQVLQVHGMLTAKYPKVGVDAETALVNIQINMFWDGLFHAFTWVMTVLGLALLWRAFRRADGPLSTRILLGSMVLGWGLFNLVEGIINHHVLHLHHVTETANHRLWDALFLASGAGMIAAGWAIIRTDRVEPATPTRPGATSRPKD